MTGGENKVGWGLPFGLWGVIAAAVVGVLSDYQASWYCWAAGLLWIALTLWAFFGMLDPASRGCMSGTLKKRSFTQIYTFLTKRWHTPLWNALCDPVKDEAAII